MTNPSHSKLCSLLGVLALTQASSGSLLAQPSVPSSVESTADREIARRQEKAVAAQSMIVAASKAAQAKDYAAAVTQYRSAYDTLPESPVNHSLRASALSGLSSATLNLAEQLIADGKYNEAENAIKELLRPGYNPNYGPAVALMAKLESSDYFNKTVTPKFVDKVKDVKVLFVEANGFYDSGRYDMAMKRCEQVLNLDPYNIAARRMEEKINLAKSQYYTESYNNTRSWMVTEVEKGWDRPIHRYGINTKGTIDQPKVDVRGTERITNLLNTIILPKVEFHEASVAEAIKFLKSKSKELDPNHLGVNIVLKIDGGSGAAGAPTPQAPAGTQPVAPAAVPPGGAASAPVAGLPEAGAGAEAQVSSGAASEARITLSLSDIPLFEALRYITYQANLKVKIDPYAVAIVPITEVTDVLVTKEYNVPPGFISNQPSEAGATAMTATPGGRGAAAAGAPDKTRGGSGITGKANAKDFLESQGVVFPEGASANYLPSNSRLIVRNTQTNLDLIDSLVDAATIAVPRQIEIEAKFVEINQNNYKELSFNWTLGAPPIKTGPNGQIAFGGGDTAIGGTNGTVTPYNRSGGLAIGANAIDALLFPTAGGAGALAPMMGMSGVLSGAQYSVLMQALDQKKGVDLLSAPRVTTKSGQKASIEVIREFIYPTEFQPPQIPTNTGGGGGAGGVGAAPTISIAPITPTTPTGFTTRNTGVTLEVEPTVGGDGYTIDLTLVPQVVEFEGFINYGSPIYAPVPISVGGLLVGLNSVLVTENTINQPIFSTRKVTTSVTVWDGQTVALGGLMREDVQKVHDKVPFLGDVPLLGRFFRSDIDQHIKRNLVIFVTAHLINPAGTPLQDDAEKEEVVTPLTGPDAQLPAALPEAPVFVK